MSDYYTIQDSDVGKLFIQAFDTPWLVSNHCGRTLKSDVGKRVFPKKDYCGRLYLQFESTDQFLARTRGKSE